MARKKNRQLPDELVARMNQTSEDCAESGDGAWWARLEETVLHYNEEQGTRFDSNETVHKWINMEK